MRASQIFNVPVLISAWWKPTDYTQTNAYDGGKKVGKNKRNPENPCWAPMPNNNLIFTSQPGPFQNIGRRPVASVCAYRCSFEGRILVWSIRSPVSPSFRKWILAILLRLLLAQKHVKRAGTAEATGNWPRSSQFIRCFTLKNSSRDGRAVGFLEQSVFLEVSGS